MEKFITHTGAAVPLKVSNVDTDQIIASKYLKRVTRTGYADALFEVWRKDPNFVLNQKEFAGASILVAGANFGSGSSREHAVWALMDYGFKVIISSSFADIFRGNSGKAGLLTIQISQDSIETLWSAMELNPHLAVTVDLQKCEIRFANTVIPFLVDPYLRWRLLEGLDDIEITLSHSAEIDAYVKNRPKWMPNMLNSGH